MGPQAKPIRRESGAPLELDGRDDLAFLLAILALSTTLKSLNFWGSPRLLVILRLHLLGAPNGASTRNFFGDWPSPSFSLFFFPFLQFSFDETTITGLTEGLSSRLPSTPPRSLLSSLPTILQEESEPVT